ncbi:hypothetical protein [Mesorhizobium sp. B2-9-1]|uniref:hypothetical protein n=1 Tax=Mesorhizobium sp. B2-9-1 TaxID=2589898 RepID=UPI001FED71F3|nr:hypothetical protein [Mesorhizobium sp. B2-9-1]
MGNDDTCLAFLALTGAEIGMGLAGAGWAAAGAGTGAKIGLASTALERHSMTR